MLTDDEIKAMKERLAGASDTLRFAFTYSWRDAPFEGANDVEFSAMGAVHSRHLDPKAKEKAEGDTEFIAHAYADIERLLKEVARLRAVVSIQYGGSPEEVDGDFWPED